MKKKNYNRYGKLICELISETFLIVYIIGSVLGGYFPYFP